MDFLGHPVFTWPIDWQEGVNGAWDYDLRDLRIGFGPDLIDPLQDHVIHGWQFKLQVRGADIPALNTFMDGLQGRAHPFWLPGPASACRIAAGVDADEFNIHAQDAAGTWTEHPARYLYFIKTGQTAQIGEIASIADLGGGLERVTLAHPLAVAVDQTWVAQPLWLVRNAEDGERVDLLAEGWHRREFRVVELPNDYDDIDPATEPIYLYRLTPEVMGATEEFRYTSHPVDVTVEGDLWLAAPIEHGRIVLSAKNGGETEISADADGVTPLQLCSTVTNPSANPFMGSVKVEILKTNTDLDPPVSLIIGRLEKPAVNGRKFTAKVNTWGGALEQPIPAMFIKRDCNYRIYDPDTCRADRVSKEVHVTIVSVNGRELTVSATALAGKPANWFAFGWVELGDWLARQARFILESSAASGSEVECTLNLPLPAGTSGSALLMPGCNGLRSTCISKFNNLVNFGGHETPVDNLTLEAIRTTPTGGKK